MELARSAGPAGHALGGTLSCNGQKAGVPVSAQRGFPGPCAFEVQGWACFRQGWIQTLGANTLAGFFSSFLSLFFFKYLFIYLAALGLSCGMRDLSLRRVGFSLVVARRLSSCSVQA